MYLDAAAATPLASDVLKAMLPYFQKHYANPSSLHKKGQQARQAVEDARKKVAVLLNATPEEIIFTSGGTESVNLALQGKALAVRKGHIITSPIEHPAVLETCRFLERNGFLVTYLPVDRFGIVSPHDIESAIRKDTILITIMYANNEIGTIQNIIKIGEIARQHKITYHTDACQAGSLELNVQKLKVDLLSLNGSKIRGPKGTGILYRQTGIALQPLLYGGRQEFGLRSGTENVPGIVGFAKALEITQRQRTKENQRQIKLRDDFIQKILKTIPGATLNGHPTQRLPNNINLSFGGIEGETVVQCLSLEHIYVSSGSACSSGTIEVSPVLKAIHALNPRGSIRVSLGEDTTKADLERVSMVLQKIIVSLRQVT
ncbi:cysteine desulfurase [Candidatus Woesearchaeota archaeon]|nr:cysteine desulfurase [Candidatus Woesearchaeota archaeon]